MAGIAGIAESGAEEKVNGMLDKIRHRGKTGKVIFETNNATFGIVWNDGESGSVKKHIAEGAAGYENSPGHYAEVKAEADNIFMMRDLTGAAPLYFGRDNNGRLCFASEVKALLPVTTAITEMPPGYTFDGTILKPVNKIRTRPHPDDDPELTASKVYRLLNQAVARVIRSDHAGAWLSGGLDSSTISALVSKFTNRLSTFVAGLKDAPDVRFAREVADFIGSEHHEVVVNLKDLIKALPDVIYHLESFDALLVRSAITNYLVSEVASRHVGEVFSGEGGDELFAGYDYLRSIPHEDLEGELENITSSLHNTALQRVDRCASAFGLVAHTIFTEPEIVEFAFSIPVEYKIRDATGKWILRKAMEGHLPDKVINRQKAKFWEGTGVGELMSEHASGEITDAEFKYERLLPGGFIINSKEELYYYRIFRDHFGPDIDLSWMGRTKGSPVEP